MTRTVIVDETEETLLAAYYRLRTLGREVQEAFACHVFALATEWAEKDQVNPRGQTGAAAPNPAGLRVVAREGGAL